MACCLVLAGCAGNSGLLDSSGKASPFRNPELSLQDASALLAAGEIGKADVLSALGPGTVVKFDSGFEVWVYRAKSSEPAAAKAEFVVLFTPSGWVRKTRIRPAYGRQP
jgi:hypothetical protein